MTPRKAAAIAHELDKKCDESFMFACKVGSGCHVSCKGTRDPDVYLTMILTLLDGIFDRLDAKPEKRVIFQKKFLKILNNYIVDKIEEYDDEGTDTQV